MDEKERNPRRCEMSGCSKSPERNLLYFHGAGRIDASDAVDEADIEPAGRVHGVVVPRLHLRAVSVASQQLAGRQRCHEAQDSTSVQVNRRVKSQLVRVGLTKLGRRSNSGGGGAGGQQQQQQQQQRAGGGRGGSMTTAAAVAAANGAILSPSDADKLVKVTLPDNEVGVALHVKCPKQ